MGGKNGAKHCEHKAQCELRIDERNMLAMHRKPCVCVCIVGESGSSRRDEEDTRAVVRR